MSNFVLISFLICIWGAIIPMLIVVIEKVQKFGLEFVPYFFLFIFLGILSTAACVSFMDE